MATDVSIYSSRTKTGYLTTVSSGTARSLGSSSFGEAATGAGGGGTGNVKTTGDQRASGEKYWDASAYFTYDVSIGQDLFVVGRNINDWDDAQDVSIAWLNANKWIDASLSRLSDVSTGGIGSAQDGSALVYVDAGAYWTYGVAGGGGVTDLSLGGLTDVKVTDASLYEVIQVNEAGTWDNRATIDIEDYFQPRAIYKTPGSGSAGTQGDMGYDSSYFYMCTSTNVWGRLLLENGY